MKLYPFQQEDLAAIDRFGGRVLLAHDMGLGKTVVSLAWLRRNGAWPAVVVCPASVKWTWEREANKSGVEALVLEGRSPRELPRRKLVIVNYDVLKSWKRSLLQLKPRCVVIDECHYVGNWTQRTRAVRSLCADVPHVLALSGTPLVNRPMELFYTLRILRSDVFDEKLTFGERFCGPTFNRWSGRREYKGSSNTAELHRLLLNSCMIRRRKADVLPELPDKIRTMVPMPLRDAGEYDEAFNDFRGWIRRHSPRRAGRAIRAEQLVKVGYLLRLAARLKTNYVVQWINEFLDSSDGKLVAFVRHRGMTRALREHCKAESVLIDGSVTGRKRKQAEERFRDDNRVRLLVGNIQAAGVGLTLTAASTVAMVELPWQPAAVTQAEDRCHRIGQRDTVWVYYLVARGTVEERLCELLQGKQETLSDVLDGGEQEGDLDIFNRLIKELRG
jgi:SNF2 family DNA or RNA helicase